jgi:hypothetical protein
MKRFVRDEAWMRGVISVEQKALAGYSPSLARVAQLDRASPSEGEGCGFDPRRAHHPSPGTPT